MMTKIFEKILPTVLLISCGSSSDTFNNVETTNTNSDWPIDTSFIQDSGPGKDDIPSLAHPNFQTIGETISYLYISYEKLQMSHFC
jgi:hypothetical protein